MSIKMLLLRSFLAAVLVTASVVGPYVLSTLLLVFWATSPIVGKHATLLFGTLPACVLLGIRPKTSVKCLLGRKSLSNKLGKRTPTPDTGTKRVTTLGQAGVVGPAPRYEAQSDTPLLDTVRKIFADTGLTSSKLVLFCNTLVVVISLAFKIANSGVKKTSKLVLLPLATSIVTLAYVIYEAEGIEIPSYLTPNFLIELITRQKQKDSSIQKYNQMIAEANIGASVKKRTFISKEQFCRYFDPQNNVPIPFEYFADLIKDHTLEKVIQMYQADSTQVKILMMTPSEMPITPEQNASLQKQAKLIRQQAPIISVHDGIRYQAQFETRLSLKLVIGAIGLCILPLVSGLVDRFNTTTNIIQATRVLDATSKFTGHLDSLGEMVLGWLGVAPDTFSEEYHIANYSSELNKYISTPNNIMLSNPILLADFKSCVYETELYLRKVRPNDFQKTTGLRGLHQACASHLAALLRTSQLAGSRQEPALVLMYGEEASGKTRLTKEVIRRFTAKMFPEIPEERRCIEITASNKYWPGLSGQPTLFADECDARGKEESLIFKNIKGLCSTAIFNCEGSAIEHKHQPAPFKMLFGTTNCTIESLRDLINEYYGRDSLKAVWSRIILVNCRRNVAKYGRVNVLERESARFDTSGNFDHVTISLHEWDEATQLPKTNRIVTIDQVVKEVEEKYTRLKHQFENPIFKAESPVGKMSIAILGRSGVGKTDFVTSSLAPKLRAQFSLGIEKKPNLVINDDKFQQKLMEPKDYIIDYDKQPDSSVFINIENLDGISSPLPLTVHPEFQYTSMRLSLKIKSDFQAFPRRFGIYPKMFSGLWNYFVWFGRRECWLDPCIEFSYTLLLTIPLPILYFISNWCFVLWSCVTVAIVVVLYYTLGMVPIYLEKNAIPTESLSSYFIDQYKNMTKMKRELLLSDSPAPQFTPNVALSLNSLSDLDTFNTSPLSCLYYDYNNFRNSSKPAKMFVTKTVAAKLVRHIAELSFSSVTDDVSTHENVIRRFARLFKTMDLPLSLVVSLGSTVYSVHEDVLYRSATAIHLEEITPDGVIAAGQIISWQDVARYQLHLVTLDELYENQEGIDFVAVSLKLHSLIGRPECIAARQEITSRNMMVARTASTEIWELAYQKLTNTVCGKILIGLLLVFTTYKAASWFFASDETSDNELVDYKTSARGKRKIGTRRKKNYVDTDSEAERVPRNLHQNRDQSSSDEEVEVQAKPKRKIGSRRKKNFVDTDEDAVKVPRASQGKFASQVKVKTQSVLTIPDLNGESGLLPAKQVLESLHKNMVHIYAVERGIGDDVIKNVDMVNFNTMFSRNYAIHIKDGFIITVGHIVNWCKNHDFYVMCDELNGTKEYACPIAKATVVKSYKERDVTVLHVPALAGKMKDISSKLLESPPEEMFGNVLFQRYGPKKQKEFFSGYMTYQPGLERITENAGRPMKISKYLITFFTITQVPLTFAGDCGLPYVCLHKGAYKFAAIHAMASVDTDTYHSISSCFFKSDLDEILKSYKPQIQGTSCPGCEVAGKWAVATDPLSKAKHGSHEIYWHKDHDNDVSVTYELLGAANIKQNDGYEYSLAIGDDAPASVPEHAHIHRYKPVEPMSRDQVFATEENHHFSARFSSVWLLHHFLTRQLPYKSYRVFFDFNGVDIHAYFNVTDLGDAKLIPFMKMQTLSAFKWVRHGKYLPKISKGIIKDPEAEPSFFSKLRNIQTERITPLCRVKGKNIPFKSKIKATPFQAIVDFPIQKFPFNANDQTLHPEKLVNAIGKFDPQLCHLRDFTVTPSKCASVIESVLLAHKNFFLSFFSRYKHLRELSDDEVFYGIDKKSDLSDGMGRLEVDTSAGFSLQTNYNVFKKSDLISVSPEGTYSWQDNEAAADLKEDFEEACKQIREGNSVFTVSCELLKDEKLKQAKLYKGRQYSCADFLQVLLERKFLGKLVAIATVQDKEVAVGIDPIVDFNTLTFRMCKHPNHFSVDFSAWDKTLPAAAFRNFFKILIELNPSYGKELNAFSEMYETSYHVIDNILFSTEGSLPSGCFLTATINSLLNNFLVLVAYCILAEENGVTPSLIHFRENVEQIAYGDDKWISTSLPWFNMISLAEKFKLFGMRMGSSEKGEELRTFMARDEVSFISRYPRQLKTGVWTGALKKVTIESFFHWTTDNSWPHLGLLLSLASYESCLWSEEYAQQVETTIKKILNACPMLKSFTYIFDPITVAEDIQNKSLIKFILDSRGETSKIDLLTRHRILRRVVLKVNLRPDSLRKLTGNYTPIKKNKNMNVNDLQWINEWAQKGKKTLCWTFVRLPTLSMCDLQIHEADWTKENCTEPIHSFQACGVNKSVAKHNCASVARKILSANHHHGQSYIAQVRQPKRYCCPRECFPVSINSEHYLSCGCQGFCVCNCLTIQKRRKHIRLLEETYPKWSVNNPITVEQCAAANFRYVQEDETTAYVRCDLCGLELSDFAYGDDPLEIHREEARACPFIIKQFYNHSKYVAQSGKSQGINVTAADQVPIAQTSSLDPSLALGNTFYTNSRVAVGADVINPLAVALNNPCGSGAPFDKKEAIFNLYQPWYSTTVNGAQAEGTEVLRISLDPTTLPTSIREYYDFHRDFIPAIDVAIFINGTAGGLGTLVLGWVPDASAARTYTIQDLYRVSNKTLSLAQTTATQQILTDNRKSGMFRSRSDNEPYPGLILMVDAPATNVQRNDTVNFPVRVYVRLPQEHCKLMSPFLSNGASTSAADIPLSAFLTENTFDATVTGPGALTIPVMIEEPDNGWNSGEFKPLPLGATPIWACSTTNPLPSSYKVLTDNHAAEKDIQDCISRTLFNNPKGMQVGANQNGTLTIDANIPDVLYVAYGKVPERPKTTFVDSVPGTKTRINKIEAYLGLASGPKYDCDTVYVQAGGLGVLVEWKLRGSWTTMTNNGYMWQVFTIKDGRLPQNQGSQVGYKEMVFPSTTSAYAPVRQSYFAILGSYLPGDTQGVSQPIRWPIGVNQTSDAPIKFTISELMRWDLPPGTANVTLDSRQLALSSLTFVSETTTGHQIALPNAMSLLTFSRVGYSSLPTNFSVGTQPPATPGLINLHRFLDSMLLSLNTEYLTFGLRFGKSQVEMIACYGNGRLMVRSVSNIQRVALSPADCYITSIKPIPNPTSVAALVSNISSWKPLQGTYQAQMWSPIAAGVGAGLSALANGLWANDARNFNAQLALQLQALKNKNMMDLENQRFNNSLSLYGAASQSMQSAVRPSFAVAPPMQEPLAQGSVNMDPIAFQHGEGTNVQAPEFIPGASVHVSEPQLSEDEKKVYS